MIDNLNGKLALVTGASKGIGAATAKALAAKGAHVILVARGADALEKVEEQIHDAGGSATIAPLDLVEDGAIGKLGAAIGSRWDALDVLVLNAATLGDLSPVEHLQPKTLANTVSLNLLANHALLVAFDPLLRKAAQAEIIALTSSVARQPRAFWGGYGASKAALETLLGSYAEEIDHVGTMRVQIVDPGATRTDMREEAFPGEDREKLKPASTVADAIVTRIASDGENGSTFRVEG